MALGHLRIDPWEWARWTLKEFNIAYEGWTQINVTDQWERARAISYYSLIAHVEKGKIKTWQDLFPLSSDKLRKKHKIKSAIIRPMTEQEKEEFKYIIQNSVPLNG